MSISKRDAIKAQRTKKKRQQRRNTLLWAVGIIIVLLLLFASPTIINALKPAGAFVRITPPAYPMENGKTIGSPNAKVKIVVYEDYQCPSCKLFTENVEKQLLASSYITNGQVNYELMMYPFLDRNSITKESHQAANASMCALDQGHFWDFHAILFANQGTAENAGAFTDKRLQAFAESLGLDMNAFNSCFKANKFSTQIEAELQQGTNSGVTGTPGVLVNGKIITPGLIPTYDDLKSAIDAALAGGG